MNASLRRVHVFMAGVALVFISACASGEPTPATTSAQESPTATPVPPEVRGVVVAFARDYRAISQDWDRLHRELDAWRNGLAASCSRLAVRSELRDFAGRADAIAEQARGLSRPASIRPAADRLIEATGKEAAGFRELRDQWQPGNPQAFEEFSAERAEAAGMLQDVQDQLHDFLGGSTGNRQPVQQFSNAFDPFSSDWESFHEDVEGFLEEVEGMAQEEALSRLDELMAEFDQIKSAAEGLPDDRAIRSSRDALTQAIAEEGAALEDLQEALDNAGSGGEGGTTGSDADVQSTPEPTPPATETPGPTSPATETPEQSADGGGNSPVYERVRARVESSDAARRQVRDDLQERLKTPASGNSADAEAFLSQLEPLLEELRDLHRDYDRWRRTEGGCDRAEADQALRDFSLRLNEISRRAHDLPGVSHARPTKELFVDAAEAEAEAMEGLEATWRPFTAAVYRGLDQRQDRARNLRRQADIGVQELLERFDIPPREEEPGSAG